MRLARFVLDNQVSYGLVDHLDDDSPTPDTVIMRLEGHPFERPQPTGEVIPLAEVKLIAPVLPSKVIAVGRNYAAHNEEMGNTAPEEPMIFIKPSTTIVGPGAPIQLPSASKQVDHEAELAIVIGRLCRDVPEADVEQVVLGITCANDVSARDLQKSDGQWGRAKGFDSFCPLGPWISLGLDPDGLDISCTVNGEVRQNSNTSYMLRDARMLVSWISHVMTLLPGDVILTGTPAGVGPLAPGDECSVTIAGIGTLTNPVIAR